MIVTVFPYEYGKCIMSQNGQTLKILQQLHNALKMIKTIFECDCLLLASSLFKKEMYFDSYYKWTEICDVNLIVIVPLVFKFFISSCFKHIWNKFFVYLTRNKECLSDQRLVPASWTYKIKPPEVFFVKRCS